MKEKIYLRIAKSKTGYVYKVDRRKNHAPLSNGESYKYKKYYPTIVVAVNVDVHDKFFREAHHELDLKIGNFEVASEISLEEDGNSN